MNLKALKDKLAREAADAEAEKKKAKNKAKKARKKGKPNPTPYHTISVTDASKCTDGANGSTMTEPFNLHIRADDTARRA